MLSFNPRSVCVSLREAGHSRGVGERDLQQGAEQVSVTEEALSHFEEALSLRRLSLNIISSNINVKAPFISSAQLSLTEVILFFHHHNPEWNSSYNLNGCFLKSLQFCFMRHRGSFQGLNMYVMVTWKPPCF